MSEDRSYIRLTWGQIVWGVGVIALIVASWADIRIQLSRSDLRQDELTSRVERLERRAGLN